MSYDATSASGQALAPPWRPAAADHAERSASLSPAAVAQATIQAGHAGHAGHGGRTRHDVLRSVLNLSDATRRGRHGCEAAADAAGRTAARLLDRQAIDGHWRAPLEGDTILESEYLLILAWAGRTSDPHAPGACRRVLAEQLPCGGWAIHPGGPVDVSASVKAYLALKIWGTTRRASRSCGPGPRSPPPAARGP